MAGKEERLEEVGLEAEGLEEAGWEEVGWEAEGLGEVGLGEEEMEEEEEEEEEQEESSADCGSCGRSRGADSGSRPGNRGTRRPAFPRPSFQASLPSTRCKCRCGSAGSDWCDL